MIHPESQSITIDNLIRLAKSTKHDKALREFSEHHHSNPELVPFLVRHARKQIRKFGWWFRQLELAPFDGLIWPHLEGM